VVIFLLTNVAAAACVGPDLIPDAPGAVDETCVNGALEVGARAAWTRPDPGIAASFDLTRARAEGGYWWDGVAGPRVAVAAVRSGGEAGYVGVDGESFVARIDAAEVRVAWPRAGIAGSLGLVDEPWVELANRAWGVRPVAATLAQDQGWLEPNDLGGWLAWTSPGRIVTVLTSATTGEGLRRRESNEGKDLGGLLIVRPVVGRGGIDPLTVTLWGRDGSIGVDAARDHRVGGRIVGAGGPVVVGVEGVVAWGLDGDAARLPLGISGWVRTPEDLPVLAWVRVDEAWAQRGVGETASTGWWVGAGPRVPLRGGSPVAIAVAVEGTRYADQAAITPDAGALANHTTMSLQAIATPRIARTVPEAP
jgi:hypothetical protein